DTAARPVVMRNSLVYFRRIGAYTLAQPMQVRMCGVSCPKVREGGGVVVYYPQCQRAAEYRCSQGVRGMMEEKGGRQNEWRKRE
ncbi:hypothetical protein KUCAC02_020015, partial [Chaenocephalus aceratus]